jgi:hypothetical protein
MSHQYLYPIADLSWLGISRSALIFTVEARQTGDESEDRRQTSA